MTFEVKSYDIKSRSTIFKLTVTSVLAVFGVIMLFSLPSQNSDNVIFVAIMGLLLTLTLPLTYTLLKTTKLSFDKDRVVRHSIFGRKELMINDIKSFGTFIQSRYSSRLVNSDEFDENEMVDTNMIFISESSTFDLGKARRAKHIRLEFRPDVYDKIKDWVKTASAQQ